MNKFLKSLFSWTVAANILGIILLTAALIVGSYFYLGIYTKHGEKIEVPDLVKKDYTAAKKILDDLGLEIIVADTIYNKRLPANMILEQTPDAGSIVKSGRFVYVVINASSSPKKQIPDIIDNSSAREAMAQLKNLGFKNVDIQYIAGEKEWVYGVKANGKYITDDTWVSIEAHLVLQVGDGTRDLGDSVTYTETPYYYEYDGLMENSEEDEYDYHEYEYESTNNNDINNLLDLDALNN